MNDLATHIQQMDEADFWNELGSRIQDAHDDTNRGDTVLIGLIISQGLFEHGNSLDRCISLGITWGVTQAEESKGKLADTSDAILEFPNDGVIYIEEIREEVVRTLGEPCRNSGCDNPRDPDGDGFSRKFCSEKCEVKFDHIRADARDAKRSEERDRDAAR